MEHRLGELAKPYRSGASGRLARAGRACTAAGAATSVVAGGGCAGAITAGVLTLAGAALERCAVIEAGIASARDPEATTGPQRRRLDARGDGG